VTGLSAVASKYEHRDWRPKSNGVQHDRNDEGIDELSHGVTRENVIYNAPCRHQHRINDSGYKRGFIYSKEYDGEHYEMKKNGGSERGEQCCKEVCSPIANHKVHPPQRAVPRFCILECTSFCGIKSRG
jgi:hypothetical protein